MESLSSVKVSALYEWLVNTLYESNYISNVYHIHFLTISQDATEVNATYHQLLDAIYH